MTTTLVPASTFDPVLATWLSGKSGRTISEYGKDLSVFADWIGAMTPAQALAMLVAGGSAAAHARAIAWRGEMIDKGFAPKTVNRRLAVLRSCVRLAQQVGACSFRLDVPGVRTQLVRDVRGPRWEDVLRIIEAEPSARNKAMLALMGHRGLRSAEVLGLEDLDVGPGAETLTITGKGRRETETVTLAPATAALVQAWLAERGNAEGSLFGLHGAMLRRIVAAAGKRVGVKCSPHALRHAAITRALDATDGDARSVRKFSRHSSLETVLAYDDRRTDVAGSVARAVTT